MNWLPFIIINVAAFVAMFVLLFSFAGSVGEAITSYRKPSSREIFVFIVLLWAQKIIAVLANLYFLLPFLQAAEKNWLAIILWGGAALWWLFAKATATVTVS